MQKHEEGSMQPSRRERFLRACIRPLLWFCCWGFPACPNCQSIDGFGAGYKGNNGKAHGYPDYAPATIEMYFCQQCRHRWERHYRMKPMWYYPVRLFPNRFMSKKTYRKILARFDYSYPEEKSPCRK